MSVKKTFCIWGLSLCMSLGACASEESEQAAPEESGFCSAAAQASAESETDSPGDEALSAVPADYDWMEELEANFAAIRERAADHYNASPPGSCRFPQSAPGGDEDPPSLTPVEGTCCSAGGLGGPDTNGDNLCDVTGGMNMFCSEETWTSLGFAPESPHAFTYRFVNYADWADPPPDNHGGFTIEAQGDPECDGIPVFYYQHVDVEAFVPPAWAEVEYDYYGEPVESEPAPCGLVGDEEADPWVASTGDLRLGTVPSGHDLDAEVETQFDSILTGAIAAYEASPPGACQFPANQGLTPLEETCCSSGGLGGMDTNGNNLCDVSTDWDYGTWSEVGFTGPGDEHALTYGFGSSEALFEVYAKADPLCQAASWHYSRRIDLSSLTFEGDGCVPVGGADAWSAATSETTDEAPTLEMAQ